MRTLVLQVHPLEESYNVALLDAVVDALDGEGTPHEVVRLAQGGAVDLERLALAGHLIVVAPTWWGAMPAQLLHWLQETLGPWIDGVDGVKADPTRSPLRTVRRLTVVTSHGSSRLVNTIQGEPGRNLWRRSVLPLCAAGATFDWIALYKIDRLEEPARRAFIDRVHDEISTITTALALD